VSILTDLREQRKLELARRQPSLCLLPFSATDLLADVQAALFPDVSQEVRLSFVGRGPLACIFHGSKPAHVYVHQVLNHPDTPTEVMSLIAKHELLHLRIRPALEGGKRVQHPKAFWEAEKALAPERQAAWRWVWWHLGPCLKRRPRLERIDVLASWKRVWSQPKLNIAACESNAAVPEQVEEVGGW
jgi:hypothetical protein